MYIPSMPLMFPEEMPDLINGKAPSDAERKVYNTFKRRLSNDFTVFYHVSWLGRYVGDSPRDGETDFVLVNPKLGVLIIEVKGGGVGRDPIKGTWFSIDRSGKKHKIDDPFEQAVSGKHSLISKIKSCTAWGKRWVDAGHAVIFPDLKRPVDLLGINTSREIAGFADDMASIDAWVVNAMKFWKAQQKPKEPIGAEGVKVLIELLAPSFELHSSLALCLETENREIIRLTQEQFSVLDFMSNQRRVAICGGAGTGKTMIAMEKAHRLAREGFKTLLTCFNKPLADHLRTCSVKQKNLSVYNFHQLCDVLGKKAGCPVREKGVGPPPPAEYYKEKLPGFLIKAVDKYPNEKFDAIVVDEGQDFADDWWTALQLSLKDPENGILYIFYDNNQSIYRKSDSFPENLVEISLTKNLRNTKAIHKVAVQFYSGQLEPKGPRGQAVQFFKSAGTDDAREKVARILGKFLRDEQLKTQDIVILSGHNKEHSKLIVDGKIGDIPLTFDHLTPEAGKVLFESVHRFKGLESKIVILADIEHFLHMDNGDELLYVGLTRAKTLLVVVGSESIRKKMDL